MMSDTDILKKAKEMFCHYDGSYFHMGRDEVLSEYRKYNISKALEAQWRHEMLDETVANMVNSKNNVFIEDNSFKYESVGREIVDKEIIDRLQKYVFENFDKLDTHTVHWIASEIETLAEVWMKEPTELIGILQKTVRKINYCKTLRALILLLKKNLERGIIIADERYDGNGGLPSHIVPEEQIQRMNEDIEEWQEMIRHG